MRVLAPGAPQHRESADEQHRRLIDEQLKRAKPGSRAHSRLKDEQARQARYASGSFDHGRSYAHAANVRETRRLAQKSAPYSHRLGIVEAAFAGVSNKKHWQARDEKLRKEAKRKGVGQFYERREHGKLQRVRKGVRRTADTTETIVGGYAGTSVASQSAYLAARKAPGVKRGALAGLMFAGMGVAAGSAAHARHTETKAQNRDELAIYRASAKARKKKK